MKNKIIIGAVVVLAAALIFENAYLLGRYNREKARRALSIRHWPAAQERIQEENVPAPAFYGNPFAEMERMQERMNRIFENSFSGMPQARNTRDNKALLSSEISFNNTGAAYVVKIGMPGLQKDAINIKVKDRQLIISGEKKKDKASEDKNYYSQESSYGNFLSHFILPPDAQISRITSDYKDGVLTITIPRQGKS